MTDLRVSQTILKGISRDRWSDVCSLTYEDRFFRRRMLTPQSGQPFVLDLPQTTSLDDGDTIEVGQDLIGIVAKPEDLLVVSGANLPQLAWHIGNRHTPCQIQEDHLLIQNDPVIAHMLDHLGAEVQKVVGPFTPEGGAYGHGRTHSHDHGHTHHG